MNKLHCHVFTCANNRDDLCELNKIIVDGPGACVKAQTCCYSFCDKNSVQNSKPYNIATEDTQINCKAENCKYNHRQRCISQDVCVGNMHHTPVVMGETECETFCAR